jgi:molecular chaperone GrpE
MGPNDADAGSGRDPGAGEGETSAASAASEPAGEIEALQLKAQDNWEQYLRAVAELENLRRRAARDVENARKYGVERFAERILPVHDSLEAGVSAASGDPQVLLDGTRATLRLLREALESVGIREIDPHGEPFDPAKHEAIGLLPSATVEPGTVLEVVQKGFEIQDRLLRPARVLVSRDESANT